MTHFTCNRLAVLLLACASLFVAPVVLGQSWSPVGGEFQGGYVRSIYVPALGGATAIGDSWAAVYYGGMFKQAAGSNTWTPMNTGLDDKRVYGFAVTASFNSNIAPYRGYAATRGGGVYKTTDGGANWTPVNNGLGCVYVYAVQFIGVAAVGATPGTNGVGATESTDRLLASTACGSSSGVYLSTDGGANWTLTSGMTPGVSVIGLTRVNPISTIDFLLAATYDGVYKSTDNGLTWALSNSAMTSSNGTNINNVTYLYNGSPAALTVYAVEANTGVWKSTDNGATWGTAPVFPRITSCCIVTDGSANGNLYFAVDGDGIYKSADRGATWTMFASNAALPGGRLVQRNTTANVVGSPIFYAQTYAGIYQSTNGGVSWNKTSAGLPGGYTVNGNFDSGGNAYVAAGEGVYKAPPSGGTFQRLGGFNLGFMYNGGHVIVTPTDVPYAITYNLGVFKYEGSNWVAKNNGLPSNLARQGGQLRADPGTANALYLGLNLGGMYYSVDGGETWTAKSANLTGKALQIRHMSVTSAYAVIATNDGVYKSTDTGANWTRLPFPAKSPANVELPIDHLRIDSGNGNIYAAVYQTSAAGATYPDSGIWKSADGGATWTQSLAGKRVHEITVARGATGVTLYAGVWEAAGGGAMQSTDEGATWTPINAGLTSYYIGNFGAPGGILKGVTTYGDGVFSFTAPAATVSLGIIPGWNLLGNGMSAPLNVATAFADAGKVTTVWKWVAATSKWAFYAPGMSSVDLAAYALTKGYDVLSTIAAGEGFWVNAKSVFTLDLAGMAVTSTAFQTALGSGWSLIATGDKITPSAFNRGLTLTPPTPDVVPVNLTTLWAWDAAQLKWYFYAPNLEASGGLAAYIGAKAYLDFGIGTLGPSVGFWVNKP